VKNDEWVYQYTDFWSRRVFKNSRTGQIAVECDGELYSYSDWEEPIESLGIPVPSEE